MNQNFKNNKGGQQAHLKKTMVACELGFIIVVETFQHVRRKT
jgi:hypothetical protein